MEGNYLFIPVPPVFFGGRMAFVAEEAVPVGVHQEALVGNLEKLGGSTSHLLDLVPQTELEVLQARELLGDWNWNPLQIVKEGPIASEDLLDLEPLRLQNHQREVLEAFDFFFFGSLSPGIPPFRLGERNGGIDEVIKGGND